MSNPIVYLFADTNLLLQCRPLEELDWSAWSNFEEVRVIISSPVLREFDYRKNKGNDYVSNRARAASSMFFSMITDDYKLIRKSGLRVTLTIESQHQYSMDFDNRLNYHERDDQLIGTVYEFAPQNPDATVRLLTHDTTPLYTARGLGLAADVIADDWLLPPENSNNEREMAALRAEITRLKKAEPSFVIRCLDRDDAEIERYEIVYTKFD
jgi:predicted ribonuclease YlaK